MAATKVCVSRDTPDIEVTIKSFSIVLNNTGHQAFQSIIISFEGQL